MTTNLHTALTPYGTTAQPARTLCLPSPIDPGGTDLVCRRAPATCGELVQGAIGGRDFLVNCPIDLWSVAQVIQRREPGVLVDDGERFDKVQRALAQLPTSISGRGYRVNVASAVPRGKGMASSSADLAAALEAVAQSAGLAASPTTLARLVTNVEPSDCVHLPGIAHVDHLRGTVVECLPAPTGLGVVVVDCGGELDTLAFDRERARAVYRDEEPVVAAVLARLKRGLRAGNLKDIAAAATASARLSQRILPKPQFEAVLELASTQGALGVNCAHSGTVLGLLHRTSDAVAERLIAAVHHRFGTALPVLGVHTVIGGGCREC